MKLEIAIIALIIVIIGLVLAVFLALVYPEQVAIYVTQIRESSGNGESPFWAVFDTVGKTMRRGFNHRVAPFFKGMVKRITKPAKVKVVKETPQITVSDCQPCHKDIYTQKAVNNLYVDHRLHSASEVKCDQCHVARASGQIELNWKKQKAHRFAGTITEEQCLKCHQRNKLSKDCSFCHPPGSILAKGVVPENKLDAFFAGRESSKKTLVPAGFSRPERAWLGGESGSPCATCHTVPENCNRCHLVIHDKLPNWRSDHGPRLLKREYAQTGCWQCHNANWCADTCHARLTNSPDPKRRHFKAPPTVPLDGYVE